MQTFDGRCCGTWGTLELYFPLLTHSCSQLYTVLPSSYALLFSVIYCTPLFLRTLALSYILYSPLLTHSCSQLYTVLPSSYALLLSVIYCTPLFSHTTLRQKWGGGVCSNIHMFPVSCDAAKNGSFIECVLRKSAALVLILEPRSIEATCIVSVDRRRSCIISYNKQQNLDGGCL